jgi:hypothetical protein
MNGNSPYQQIYQYCQKEKKDKIIERILYHKYTEELTELIDSYKKDNSDKEPTKDTIEGYTATLLSKNNLSKNVRLAEEELDDVLDVKIKKIKKEIGRVNFWKSVWASVLASFIFVLLLIAFFLVAENQVKSLFHIDANGNSKTEQLKESNSK